MLIPREDQFQVIDQVRDHLRHGARRILVVCPTGFGKTVVSGYMIRESLRRGYKSWFWVHRRELVKQSRKALDKFGVDHGIVSAGFPMQAYKPVQITSIDTLRRRLDRVAIPDLIFVDEAHHSCSKTWGETLNKFTDEKIIGFTATPERLDGQGLGEYFDVMVIGPSISWLIQNGHLCPYRYFEPPSIIDPSELRTKMGDYDLKQMASLIDKPTITGSVVDHYIAQASGRRGIIFASSLEHSRHVVEQFNLQGIPAEHVDGKTPENVRDGAIRRLEEGRTKILSNVGLFGEGVDLPVVEYIGLLRLTQSLALFLQMAGRGLRTNEGKEDCIIMDHMNHRPLHGNITDDRQWTLDAKPRRKRTKEPPKVSIWCCPKCLSTNFKSDKYCVCGFIPIAAGRKIDEVDGLLKEVNQEEAEIVVRDRKRIQAQARTMEQLVAEGRRRGMDNPEGWARHVYAARMNRMVR